MKLTVIGTGYVGLVTGVCLADIGHHVVCVDVDESRIESLRKGLVSIYEPSLTAMLRSALHHQHINFTTDLKIALESCEAIFIAVGTPPSDDGSTDLQYVLAAARAIGSFLSSNCFVIVKSTVPVGTCARVKTEIQHQLYTRHLDYQVEIISNPEFLKEGTAVADFTRPDRIIVGCESQTASDLMHKIYAPYNRKREKIFCMDTISAELTKYAANAMLATKISFINEMANIAECVGADIEQVRLGIGSDPRIGYDFLYAGCGYGGSCFPKDIKSLAHLARSLGYHSELLESVDRINQRQKNILFSRLYHHFQGNLAGKTFALWGLAFKPNTDDVREAPSRALMEALWEVGASVRAYDPQALAQIQNIYGARPDLFLCTSKEDALCGSSALIICTEWKEFYVPDFEMCKNLLENAVIVDGRNLYDPILIRAQGFTYYGIGRGAIVGSAPDSEGA